jgi:hypothetical protein
MLSLGLHSLCSNGHKKAQNSGFLDQHTAAIAALSQFKKRREDQNWQRAYSFCASCAFLRLIDLAAAGGHAALSVYK